MQNILFVLKKYTKDMIIIAFIILCLALSIYSIYQSQNEDDTTIPTDLMAGDDIEEDLDFLLLL